MTRRGRFREQARALGGRLLMAGLPLAFPAVLLFVFAEGVPARAGEDHAAPLALDSGPILGRLVNAEAGVRAYLGIPFAAPPVGPLRWRPPQPVAAWTEPRPCLDFGPACPQPRNPMGRDVGRQDEDCLYLNVWTAGAPGEKRPVMLWIHGGGNTIGSSSQKHYNGEALAAAGVVLVSTNYRLGPFGYFAHPELSAEAADGAVDGAAKNAGEGVSGNQGTLDQIAALRWIRRNIAAFGGDPGKVTIFGESAGGVNCNVLLTSPLAKGFFHRAILQSGTAVGIRRHLRKPGPDGEASGEAQGAALMKALEARDLAAMRALPAEAILKAAKPKVGFLGKGENWNPVVDGHVLHDTPLATMAAGKQHDIPILLGTNADEGTLFGHMIPIRRRIGYNWTIRRLYKDDAEAVLALFPAATDAEVRPQLFKLLTVQAFVAPARLVARLHETVPSKTYLYHFTRVTPVGERTGMGATHGIEIPYIFDSSERVLGTPEDRALGEVMRAAWIRFATTGDPNLPPATPSESVAPPSSVAAAYTGPPMPSWPAFTTANDTHLEFGDDVRTGTGLHAEACDLFETLARETLALPPSPLPSRTPAHEPAPVGAPAP